jgi:hypothetical protein
VEAAGDGQVAREHIREQRDERHARDRDDTDARRAVAPQQG